MEKILAKAWLWLMAVVCAGVVAYIMYRGWPASVVGLSAATVVVVTFWAYMVVSEDL
jgi:hypothetical protein